MKASIGIEPIALAIGCLFAQSAPAATFISLSVGIGARASVSDPDGLGHTVNTGTDAVEDLTELPADPITLSAESLAVRSKNGVVLGSVDVSESGALSLVTPDHGTFVMHGTATAAAAAPGVVATAQNIVAVGLTTFLRYDFAVDEATPFEFKYQQNDLNPCCLSTIYLQLMRTDMPDLLIDQGLAPDGSGTITAELAVGTYYLLLGRGAANIAVVQKTVGASSGSHDDSYSFRIGAADPITGAAALPEPASWTLMIVGIGAVGATMRRRAVTASYAAA